MSYDLATFRRTARRVPHVGFFHVEHALDLLPRGSFFIFPPGAESSVSGADLAARGLRPVAFIADDPFMFESDTWCFSRFTEARDWLAARAITPLALMWGEEWHTRPDVKTWPYFAGFSGMAFADRLRTRVDQILVLLRSVMPGVPIVQVENFWNDDPLLGGADFYRPVFTQADVLGIDSYLTTAGVPAWGTGPLTSIADQTMLNKFYTEVGRFVEHAATYGKPLMLVGQAFRIPESPLWAVAPTPDQLEWFYVLAQGTPACVGLGWFAVEEWANGLLRSDLAVQAQRVQELCAYNASLA